MKHCIQTCCTVGALLLLFSCSENTSGTTVVTDNVMQARIERVDGTPAAGAEILLKQRMTPDTSSLRLPPVRRVVADSLGLFEISLTGAEDGVLLLRDTTVPGGTQALWIDSLGGLSTSDPLILRVTQRVAVVHLGCDSNTVGRSAVWAHGTQVSTFSGDTTWTDEVPVGQWHLQILASTTASDSLTQQGDAGPVDIPNRPGTTIQVVTTSGAGTVFLSSIGLTRSSSGTSAGTTGTAGSSASGTMGSSAAGVSSSGP